MYQSKTKDCQLSICSSFGPIRRDAEEKLALDVWLETSSGEWTESVYPDTDYASADFLARLAMARLLERFFTRTRIECGRL